MSEEWKNRLESLLTTAKVAFHWGYIPFIIYLGFKQGADPGLPPLHPLQLLWV